MKKEWIHRYLPIIILIILVSVSFTIIRNYTVAIIGAFIVTYLVYPLHKKLSKKIPQSLSALITILTTILIIFLPLFIIVKEIVSQIYKAIQSGAITDLIFKIENLSIIKNYDVNISELTNNFVNFGIKSLSSITVSLATSIVSLFIMIFLIYYLLIDWSKLSLKLKNYIPFDNKEKIMNDIGSTTQNIVRGTLFLAIIESIVAGIGFWIAGVDFYLILASLIGLFAFLPGGPAIVWVPTLIIKFLNQEYISSAIILIFGLLVSIYLDIIVRTKVAGQKSNIHPGIMLLGVIGGTPIFGLSGIIVGPLLLSYTLEILEEILSQR